MDSHTDAATGPATTTDAPSVLTLARQSYARHEWESTFHLLTQVDASSPLVAEDLDRLAWSAGLTTRDDQMLVLLERLHDARVQAADLQGAARAALWLGFRLFARGEASRAGAWLARAHKLADEVGPECVEQGYLLLPQAQRLMNIGDDRAAGETAARAVVLAERRADRDLLAFASNLQGRALLRQARVDEGLALMDEAMIAVGSGQLAPVVTGLVYCSAIAACQRVGALDRMREWTAALDRWCGERPQLVLFKGHCRIHRAQVFALDGDWVRALDEARAAVALCVGDFDRDALGLAHYEQAEIHRQRGDAALADGAYREASRCGLDPQPGRALLQLQTGELHTAAATMRRLLGTLTDPLARARCLPAQLDTMLAAGDVDAARAAAAELAQVAATWRTPVFAAQAREAAASLLLCDGRATDLPATIGPAREVWLQLRAPLRLARLRVLLARAWLALGDADGALLEIDGAHDTFERLGALPDLQALHALRQRAQAQVPAPHAARSAQATDPTAALTERERQVLRLVATGLTTKAIARQLGLSPKTVDRHLGNLFAKLGVASRAAATAWAYEHKLV
ncbi:helix-turn-helix domain-containing protein [Aquabacterium humicola]|uniref:helix-turn-helix domain-containing protein n=1 Tax=Aquabacterium humicola TaxID=3237377 RepID=UPI0025431546|nr:helix-turn-helix transcriptional regulator [Rubrivivax pictus]